MCFFGLLNHVYNYFSEMRNYFRMIGFCVHCFFRLWIEKMCISRIDIGSICSY